LEDEEELLNQLNDEENQDRSSQISSSKPATSSNQNIGMMKSLQPSTPMPYQLPDKNQSQT
jgi:hypothetical protein